MVSREFVFAGAAAVSLGLSASAQAEEDEEDYRTIVTIMRACLTIEEVAARVTCYDNNIRPRDGGPSVDASVSSGGSEHPRQAGREFGAEEVFRERDTRPESRLDEIEAHVTGSRFVEPGIWLITLADGAEWRMVDSAGFSYEAPREGDTILLERGALGSVYMRFDGQRALRVQRVR